MWVTQHTKKDHNSLVIYCNHTLYPQKWPEWSVTIGVPTAVSRLVRRAKFTGHSSISAHLRRHRTGLLMCFGVCKWLIKHITYDLQPPTTPNL